MYRFIYTDRRDPQTRQLVAGSVVLVCDAPDILQADNILRERTGIIAAREPFVTCSFEEVKCAAIP